MLLGEIKRDRKQLEQHEAVIDDDRQPPVRIDGQKFRRARAGVADLDRQMLVVEPKLFRHPQRAERAGAGNAVDAQAHDLRQRIGHRLAAGRGVGRATEIAGAQFLLGKHALDRLDDGGRGFALAEMLEHHRPRPDLADRIGDVLPGDIRRRAVHRLEHGREICAPD